MSDKKSILKQKILSKKLERTSKLSIERTKEKLIEKFEKLQKENPSLAQEVKEKLNIINNQNKV